MYLREIKTSLGVCALCLALFASMSPSAWAQSVVGDPENLVFEVVNVTTGGPGEIERLQLQYSSARLQPVFDIQPQGSSIPVGDVPVRRRGSYILIAHAKGVPYYWSLRGADLMENPVKLHIFDTVQGLDELNIVGMNLLIRKTETLLELEYLIQVDNPLRPQATVVGPPYVRLGLPAEARTATLSFGNGPEQETLVLEGLSGYADLKAPLVTGRNALRVTTSLPWSENLTLAVGANIPLLDWSLMATPATLDIQAYDLTPADVGGMESHVRFKGPQVAAGDDFSFRMRSTAGAQEGENLFQQTASEEEKASETAAGEEKDEERGFPFIALSPILLIIIVISARRRRQRRS